MHEASLVPIDQYHLYRWQMREPFPWPGFRRRVEQQRDYIEQVYQRVVDEGPLVAGDLKARVGKKGTWWDHDDGKTALEALFYLGRITARRRPHDFARVYDVAERMISAEALARPALPEHEARKELLVLAAKYHGVGTLKDLADYHRLAPSRCKQAMAELVEEGRVLPATVREWDRPAYLHPEARQPRRIRARALLSPFDPVVWNRDRALRMFGFHYRIEIYTPPPKRQYGYYVLPFLLGDELVGRVDLKADRANRALLVQSAWAEPGVNEREVAAELMEELRLMASWLELDRIEVTGRGDLGPVGAGGGRARAGAADHDEGVPPSPPPPPRSAVPARGPPGPGAAWAGGRPQGPQKGGDGHGPPDPDRAEEALGASPPAGRGSAAAGVWGVAVLDRASRPRPRWGGAAAGGDS